MKITLASASPRRRELLSSLGFELKIMPSSAEEELLTGLSPEETVRHIALLKARDVARSADVFPVVAADTLVYLDGRPLGKPRGEQDAKSMLRALSGRSHHVASGVAVISGARELSSSETTEVFFRELSEREIDWYVKTGEPMDKAGAYGIQGLGSVFIERIDGDFFNVMGLPLCRLCLMLRELGYDMIG